MVPQRPARPALAALAVAGLLAGCAAQPGTAASINGVRVSEDDLADAHGDYVALTNQPTEPAVVLNTMLAAEVLPGIAAEHDVVLSDDDVVSLLDRQAEAAGTTAPEDGYSDAFVDLGRYLFLVPSLQNAQQGQAVLEEFSTAMADADIEVNPRYGTVDETGIISPLSPDWIAQPEGADPGLDR
ncbi:hypothetical protein MF406_04885 [Georgenia sp. TF02-10]|uniref:hypothetical protein n=1 Tax=Georgenia sp. TF02-10 TaxID=2917725 RepID=UPI001FA81212|nr:hypothetical protein [Georgenia sp. TF02-10]UNX55600.1 hypothetical protein MF406_04885 [Georgenia sp. TF02-10]